MKPSFLVWSLAALLTAPLSAVASEAMWRVQGSIDVVEGAAVPGGVNVGDAFSVVLHFDTDAPVTNPSVCGDGGVGTLCRHNGDPAMYYSDIQLGSLFVPSFSGSAGDQSTIVRNNAPDPAFGDTVDGYTFGVRRFNDASENTNAQVLLRGPEDLDVVTDGRILPAVPPAGLMSLRSRVFEVCDSQVDFDCYHFYLSGTINSIVAVPEPETLALMFAGLGVVAFSARRQKR